MNSAPPLPLPGSVAILGLGLIGGSLALALRAASRDIRLVAVDTRETLDDPRARDAVDLRIPLSDPAAIDSALASAELTVLAAPVNVIRSLLPGALERSPCVTDCGSTKRAIVEVAHASPGRARFVPGHPMAGEPGGGVARARADLFQGRPWIVCPEHADPGAIAKVRSLVLAAGAEWVEMDADWHDRAVAVTSHVPQLVASALLVQAARTHALSAAGPGFASATRVAGGADAMWRPIFDSNRDHVAAELRALCRTLSAVADDLDADPGGVDAAIAVLTDARALREPSR